MNPKLHIIALDIPYPANYGGAIDMFYRIQYLCEAGIDIYLHCFKYGQRTEAKVLNSFCKEVWYYPRKTGLKGLSLRLPYMVYSRRDALLLKRLQDIDAPILFEGVHSSYYMHHASLQNRVKLLRNHNVEHYYFAKLAQKAGSMLHQMYYLFEAALLKKYEANLQPIQAFLPISQTDYNFFHSLYPQSKFILCPPYHPYKKVATQLGKGAYCLFHGNLKHPENKEAVMYLLKEVVAQCDTHFIIAGLQPDTELTAACNAHRNCTLVANPTNKEMELFISNAHIQLMLTFQATGMKIKLLMALYLGRFVVANNFMLQGTGLHGACTIANDTAAVINAINSLMLQSINQNDIDLRNDLLKNTYNNTLNTQAIIKLLGH